MTEAPVSTRRENGTLFDIKFTVSIGVEKQAATGEGVKEGVCCCWEEVTGVNLGLFELCSSLPQTTCQAWKCHDAVQDEAL